MTFDEAAFIVTGRAIEDGPGWEQQQSCEERQQVEAELAMLSHRISHHLLGIERALRDMQQLHGIVAPTDMYTGHIASQGGHDHEL